jgi:hypothetical protein
MLRLPLLLIRFSLCSLQLITQETLKHLKVIIVKGVLIDAIEVEVVIIIKEEGEHLYRLVIIAFTRIFSKI